MSKHWVKPNDKLKWTLCQPYLSSTSCSVSVVTYSRTGQWMKAVSIMCILCYPQFCEKKIFVNLQISSIFAFFCETEMVQFLLAHSIIECWNINGENTKMHFSFLILSWNVGGILHQNLPDNMKWPKRFRSKVLSRETQTQRNTRGLQSAFSYKALDLFLLGETRRKELPRESSKKT